MSAALVQDKILSRRFESGALFDVAVKPERVAKLREQLGGRGLERQAREFCFLCQDRTFFRLARFDRYGLPVDTLLCETCGLIQASPVFTEAAVGKFYSEIYRQMKDGETESDFEKRFERQQARGKLLLPRIPETLLKRANTSSKALESRAPRAVEVGCAAGGIVSVLREAGFEAMGFDLDPTFLEKGKKKGLPLYAGDFPGNFSGQKWDLILIRHVLEHMVDPRQTLRLAREHLATGGFLYIEVPGVRALDKGKYRHDFMQFLVIEHLFHFELKTLRALVESEGFEFVDGDESVWGLFQVHSGKKSTGTFWEGRAEAMLEMLERNENKFEAERRWSFLKSVSLLRPVRRVLSRWF